MHGDHRVWYRGRTYLHPQTVGLSSLVVAYGPLVPTGQHVVGLPVLEPEGSMTSRDVPTVLILRQNATMCIVYTLGGGAAGGR